MTLRYHSGVFTLETEQLLSARAEPVWLFFSNPSNLPKIIPTELGFEITSTRQTDTYPGQIITYRIAPFPLVHFNWVTEITRVHTGYYFVDEQRFGPFAIWHHEHFFDNREDGVLMRDKVTFKMKYGWFGRMVFRLWVRQKLMAVFTHRAKMAQSVFSNDNATFNYAKA